MISFRQRATVLGFLLAFCSLGGGQTSQQQVSNAFAVLTTSLDSKSAVEGQQLSLRTIADVSFNGRIIIPANSIVLGHITKVAPKSKENSQGALALVIDKAVPPKGGQLALQAIVAAVAAPADQSLASDPTSAMMRSNEPKMTSNPSTASSSGELSASSKANSGAAVAAAEIRGEIDKFVLNENSQGAVGYEGLSISWVLLSPPPVTIFTAKRKDVKLLQGTQVLLRMVPPSLAK